MPYRSGHSAHGELRSDRQFPAARPNPKQELSKRAWLTGKSPDTRNPDTGSSAISRGPILAPRP